MKSASIKLDTAGPVAPKSRLLAFVTKQLREVVPPTLFFAIGFNLIVLTTQLVLADYLIHFANFMLVTLSALVVGKAVVVANALPFFRRFDTAPLIQPVLFKTALVRLSRLTEAHTLDELRDRNTPTHMEMIGLISGLAMRKTPSKR